MAGSAYFRSFKRLIDEVTVLRTMNHALATRIVLAAEGRWPCSGCGASLESVANRMLGRCSDCEARKSRGQGGLMAGPESLALQLRTGNPNTGRVEHHLDDGRYFSIAVEPGERRQS